MSNAVIDKTIQNYLKAVEQQFGQENREKTVLKHLGSSTFFLKKHNVKQGRTVDMGDLQLMTQHLETV